MTIDLAVGQGFGGDAEGDTLTGIENVTGSDLTDFLYGDVGSNVLKGRAGRDWLYGGDGQDVIHGGAGDDFIDGGLGDDRLIGGAGAEIFRFGAGGSQGFGHDVITDFALGEDLIDLSLVSGIKGFGFLDIQDTFQGALIAVGGGTILLQGVSASELSANDVLL